MIKIIKTPKTGLYVNVSKTQKDPTNPKGYFMVEEKTVTRNADGWRATVTKTMLFKGLISELEQDIKDMDYKMSGCLYIEEILESQLDTRIDLKKRVLPKELREIPLDQLDGTDIATYEKAISGSVKRTGSEGIELMSQGERILRFTSYDPSGNKTDTLIDYDNFSEVAEYQKTQNEKEAELPAGEPTAKTETTKAPK